MYLFVLLALGLRVAREQQQEARDHGERQADDARPFALMHRQGGGNDGDDDDIVDPENDLEAGQGQEAQQGFRSRT